MLDSIPVTTHLVVLFIGVLLGAAGWHLWHRHRWLKESRVDDKLLAELEQDIKESQVLIDKADELLAEVSREDLNHKVYYALYANDDFMIQRPSLDQAQNCAQEYINLGVARLRIEQFVDGVHSETLEYDRDADCWASLNEEIDHLVGDLLARRISAEEFNKLSEDLRARGAPVPAEEVKA